jgi:Glycosyl transferase family 2
MKLVMAMKVRDECDVLEHNLRHHRAHGVDQFIVTDNGSTDGTLEILRRWEGAGLVRLIEEPAAEDFRDQAHGWVTRMARLAAIDHAADWVVHADADEFWWPAGGSLKDALAEIPERYGVVLAPRPEFVARTDDPRPFWERMTVREARSRLRPKVAHRAEPDVVLHRGAHDVAIEGAEATRHSGRAVMRSVKAERPSQEDALVWAARWPARVFHFPVRSAEQHRRKVEVALRGGFEDRAHDDLRQAYEQGRADELYEELVADEDTVEAGLRDGSLVVDERVRDFLDRVPDPLEQPDAVTEFPAPLPEQLSAELREIELDAMQTMARTQRSLVRQLDSLRRRVERQRRRAESAERGRHWSRLRSGAARFLRQRREA